MANALNAFANANKSISETLLTAAISVASVIFMAIAMPSAASAYYSPDSPARKKNFFSNPLVIVGIVMLILLTSLFVIN